MVAKKKKIINKTLKVGIKLKICFKAFSLTFNITIKKKFQIKKKNKNISKIQKIIE